MAGRRFRCLATGVPTELLTLEVTESLAVDEHATNVLKEIRRTGVLVAIDDFGTGYSALAAVSRLPIDVLKIDRSIVRRAGHRDGRAVLAAILAIADSLDLRTVAEGIESSDDERRLVDLGCQFAQGYLFGKPLAPAAAERVLER
jgi:EAL domain-containing protein (putative c-di-GMP-specific phosphodiesterase class I)